MTVCSKIARCPTRNLFLQTRMLWQTLRRRPGLCNVKLGRKPRDGTDVARLAELLHMGVMECSRAVKLQRYALDVDA